VIDEKFLLRISCVNIKQKRVLVKTDLRRDFHIDLSAHELLAIDLEKRQFALVTVVNHRLELFQISGKIIPKITQNPV
jgi:hypothetical protein